MAAHLARLCLGATVVGWLFWRRHRHKVGERDKDPFKAVLSYASDDQLIKLHNDYETLVGLEMNPAFVQKLDSCAAEMLKRGLSRPSVPDPEAKTVIRH